VSLEMRVKGAFLLNFARFVQWPADAFASPEAPLVIGVAGAAPFGQALDALVAGNAIGGRPVEVRRIALETEEAPAEGKAKLTAGCAAALRVCHVLFLPGAESSKTAQFLAALGQAPVLTVGERDGFAAAGGSVGFFLESGKVRFEMRPDVARACRLEPSAKLLQLARIVPPPAAP